ncbi:LlaJI family restriction endonuclease [Bacillus sp. CFBP9009]
MRHEQHYISVIEYKEYDNNYPEEFVNKLINREICSVKNNKIKFKATGILIYKNTFIIIFPKNYNVTNDEQDLKEHAQVLFQVLIKYKREAKITPEEMDLLGGDEGQNKENLYTAYRLILDFTQNGPFKKEMRIKSSAHSGNIDWTATINKKQPVFSGGSAIYTDTISQKTTIDRHNLLLKLYHYCVLKSIEKYGWLFGVSLENLNMDVNGLPCDIHFAVNFLTKELNSTFVEREMNVIRLLRDFLSGIELKNYDDNLDILVTPYFHNVWEVICGHNFNNQYSSLKQIIPKLKWEIESTAKVQSQRPDIMVLREQTMYILDAKYYDIDTNLPGWPDVVKQLFYAFTILKNIESEKFKLSDDKLERKIKKIKMVENAFLFPSGDYEPIKNIGKVNIEENKDLGDIKAYKVNTFLAMKCYIGKEKYNFLNKIV